MKMAALPMKMAFRNESHSFALWLPLFLLWPLVLVFLLAVFVLMLPFALLGIIFTWDAGWWRPMLLWFPAFISLVCHLPGTISMSMAARAGFISSSFNKVTLA